MINHHLEMFWNEESGYKGSVWWGSFTAGNDGLWRFMTVYDGWRILTDFDGLWRIMTDYDEVRCGGDLFYWKCWCLKRKWCSKIKERVFMSRLRYLWISNERDGCSVKSLDEVSRGDDSEANGRERKGVHVYFEVDITFWYSMRKSAINVWFSFILCDMISVSTYTDVVHNLNHYMF